MKDWSHSRKIVFLLGVVLIIIALASELWQGAQAGLGPLQILLITVGVLLALISHQIHRLPTSFFINLLVMLIMFGFMLGIAEIGLGLAGYQVLYTPEHQQKAQQPISFSDWQVCDEVLGCRGSATSPYTCQQMADFYEQRCLNPQGYPSPHVFDPVPEDDERLRVMLLGDSFTAGNSSTSGNSWVEVLDRALNDHTETLVWNFGVGSTGTRQAIGIAQHYLPMMRPHLVILGFFVGNDFEDNLYPLPHYRFVQLEDGTTTNTLLYDIDAQGTPTPFAQDQLYYIIRGIHPPHDDLDRFLGQTRLGSLLVGARFGLRPTIPDEVQYNITRELITELTQVVAQNSDAEFWILLIPDMDGLDTPTPDYQQAKAIFEQNNLLVMDTLPLLTRQDYTTPDDPTGTMTGIVKALNLPMTPSCNG